MTESNDMAIFRILLMLTAEGRAWLDIDYDDQEEAMIEAEQSSNKDDVDGTLVVEFRKDHAEDFGEEVQVVASYGEFEGAGI